jgi:perosamine synthetase
LGIGDGDEVIVPNTTFIASATSVEMTGAKPVFIDVEPDNFHIDCTKIKDVINEKTKAIMPVHIFGSTAKMDEIKKYAKENNIFIIEDACQAFGIKYKDKYCGTIGDIGCFSFFADKIITTGEGGYICTDNDELFYNLKYKRNQGRIDRGSFIHPEIGYNFRMNDIQMAIGIVQLSKLEYIKKRKIEIYNEYRKNIIENSEIRFTINNADSEFIPFRVTLMVERVNDLMDFLKSQNIETRSYFYPLNKQPCFRNKKYSINWEKELDDCFFENSIYAYEHGICLPSHLLLTKDQIEYVCDRILYFYKNK